MTREVDFLARGCTVNGQIGFGAVLAQNPGIPGFCVVLRGEDGGALDAVKVPQIDPE